MILDDMAGTTLKAQVAMLAERELRILLRTMRALARLRGFESRTLRFAPGPRCSWPRVRILY